MKCNVCSLFLYYYSSLNLSEVFFLLPIDLFPMKKHLAVISVTLASAFIGLLVVGCLQVRASNNFNIVYDLGQTIVTIHHNDKVKDYTPIVDAVLDSVAGKNNVLIVFDKGVYRFYPERANSKYLNISNNDSGIKRVVFHLIGHTSFEIDGGSSDFIFYGKLVPFQIGNSKNVLLHHFTINWDSPFVFEGLVVDNNSTAKSFDVKIPIGIKYKISDNKLQYSGYDWSIGLGENIVYNVESKRPYYYTSKYENDWRKSTLSAEDLGSRVVRLKGTTAEVPPIGSLYVDKGPHGQNRLYPAIFVDQSQNVNLTSINIYHSGAMALIAQKTNTVHLLKFNVI